MTTSASKSENTSTRGSAIVSDSRQSLLTSLAPYVIVAILSVLIVAVVYHFWKIDWRVPLNTDPDAHQQQAIVKNFVEGGHFYVNPSLGAPGQQELYDFPLPHWTHLIVWDVLRLFSHNYGVVLNLYFFLTYPLCALTGLYALRRFGISTGLAIAGAVLFAFSPFHTLRSESHIFLSSLYTLPLAAMVCVWLAVGNPLFGFQLSDQMPSRPPITKDGVIALASCVLMGWDHPYYAFFTAGFLLIGGLLGQFRYEHRRTLITALLMCAVVAAALFTALLPNILYFHTQGRVAVGQRLPEESERYPLTIVQLIAPIQTHRVPFLNHIRQFYDQRAEMVNENSTATLGFLGSVGLFVSLASLFRKRSSEFLYSLGILNLWALLVGIMGGFGALFAFLVSPQVRAYNRISVFIAFFSTAALIWTIDCWMRSRQSESQFMGLLIIPSLLLTIGILDQVPDHSRIPRSIVEAEFNQQGAFISRIDNLLPPHSMIFQLPYACYPECGGVNRMEQDSHLVGYLHSSNLRWSYGAMHFRPTDRWQERVAAEPPDQMVQSLADAGFAGIYIDRYGYADNGAALETQLRKLLKSEPITDSRGRYLFFRLNR